MTKNKLYKTAEEANPTDNEVVYPVWDENKTRKIIDYCEECGQKTGSHIEVDRRGKPLGYKKRKKTYMDVVQEYYDNAFIKYFNKKHDQK